MTSDPIEEDRQNRIAELDSEGSDDWREQFSAGSFGCHELLDRVSLFANQLDQFILDHPSCVQNPAWFALAHQAVDALNDLYQKIGAEHLIESSVAVVEREAP